MSHFRRTSIFLAAVLVAAVTLSCTSSRSQDREAFQRGVERMVDRVEDAWNAGDADALTALFTRSATLRDPEGRWVSGRDEIRGYLKGWMGRAAEGAKEIEVTRRQRIGDDAALIDVVSTLLGDRQREPLERYEVTAVVQRDGDAWRFVAWRVGRGSL